MSYGGISNDQCVAVCGFRCFLCTIHQVNNTSKLGFVTQGRSRGVHVTIYVKMKKQVCSSSINNNNNNNNY